MVEFSGSDGGLAIYAEDLLESINECGLPSIYHSSKTTRNGKPLPPFIEVTNAFSYMKSSNSVYKKFFFFITGLVKVIFRAEKRKRIINFHLFDYKWANMFTIFCLKFVSHKLVVTIHDAEAFRDSDAVSGQRNRLKIVSKLSNVIMVHSSVAFEELILNGVDPLKLIKLPMRMPKKSTFKSKFKQKFNDGYKFLIIGSLKRSKNIEVAIKAFKMVVDKFPNSKLKIVGFDIDGISDELNSLSKSLGLSDYLVVENVFLSDREFDEEMRSSNCIILPYSKIYQSHVLLQAISRSIPVITSNLKGFRDTLGEYGNYFSPGCSTELSKKIMDVMKNYDQYVNRSVDLKARMDSSDNESSYYIKFIELIL